MWYFQYWDYRHNAYTWDIYLELVVAVYWSLGNDIVFRVAFKPVSSISQSQHTLSYDGQSSTLAIKGRHDPCVMPRTPPLVEAMSALVIADLALRQRARAGPKPLPILKVSDEFTDCFNDV